MVKGEVRKLLESGNKVWGYWRVSTAKHKMEKQIQRAFKDFQFYFVFFGIIAHK